MAAAGSGSFEEHSAVVETFDPIEVETWTVSQVCTKFLDPLGLSPLKQIFVDHKITGHVLMTLEKRDLVEMQIHAVGDRVYIDKCLIELRRKARKVERERTLWEGKTPSGGIAYHNSCWEMLLFKFFPCCMQFTHWKVSSQGIRKRMNPPSCNVCCVSMQNDFSDYRFLKDIDWYKRPMCLWCKPRKYVELLFDAKSSHSIASDSVTKEVESKAGCCGGKRVTGSGQLNCHRIMHPEMTEEMTTVIRNAWTEARLVAD